MEGGRGGKGRGVLHTCPKPISCFLGRPVGHSANPEIGQARGPQTGFSSLGVAQLLRLPVGPSPFSPLSLLAIQESNARKDGGTVRL